MPQLARATTGHPAIHPTRRRHVVIALGAVIAVHMGLLAWTLAARDRLAERPLEARTITAMLLRPTPEPVVPAAVVPPAPPETARAPVRAKPTPPPRVKAQWSTAAPTPTLPPPLKDAAPSPGAAPLPVPAAPSPATTASAPAIEHTVPLGSASKNVSHVECNIPKPDYPDISKRRGENGTAIVRFVVGLTGHVETAQLQRSSGYPRLDDAALDAIHASICQPYRENGDALRAAYSQSFVFGLTD